MTLSFVNAVPSYGLESVALVNVTFRLEIVNLPGTTLTTTFSVTSLPSFVTLAVPSILVVYSPESVPVAFAVKSETMYPSATSPKPSID